MDPATLRDILLRHEKGAERLEAGEAAKIGRLLNGAIETAKRDLAARHIIAQEKGRDKGPKRTQYLEELIASYTAINEEVYDKIAKRLEGSLIERARHESDFANRAVKTAGGATTGFRPPDTNYLRALVNNTPIPTDKHGSALLKPWVKGMADGDLKRFENAVREGLVLGETADQLAKRIEEGGWAKSRRSAQTVAITAHTAIANEARLDTFRKMKGITHVEWSSVNDSRTSEICIERSGKIWDITEPHPVPPAHPRCRSMLLPRKDGTSPPLHKPHPESPQAKGTVKTPITLDEMKRADAKLVVAEAPKPFSPIDASVTADSIRVDPKRVIVQRMSAKMARAATDARYDPVPEYRGIKATDFGKAQLGAAFTDEAASLLDAIMPELDNLAAAFNVPAIRAVKTGNGSYIATMGDGTLTVNPIYFNGYATGVGGKTGGQAAVKAIAERDALGAELKAAKEKIDAIKVRITSLSGADRDKAIFEYMDMVESFNSRRKVWIKLDKDVRKARATDGAATKPVSTWKPGDGEKTRPHNATDYFAGIDRARMVFFHEFAHNVHQMTGKTGRRNKVGAPIVEQRLKRMFFEKFHGAAPGNLQGRGIERRALVSTSYATTNEMEWFAESFGLYMMGRRDLVDDDIAALIEELLEAAKS